MGSRIKVIYDLTIVLVPFKVYSYHWSCIPEIPNRTTIKEAFVNWEYRGSSHRFVVTCEPCRSGIHESRLRILNESTKTIVHISSTNKVVNIICRVQKHVINIRSVFNFTCYVLVPFAKCRSCIPNSQEHINRLVR
jgi:hypothetical protein